jgi:hypothetical protein
LYDLLFKQQNYCAVIKDEEGVPLSDQRAIRKELLERFLFKYRLIEALVIQKHIQIITPIIG